MKLIHVLLALLAPAVACPGPAAAQTADTPEELLNAAATYEWTASRTALQKIEALVARSSTNAALQSTLARQMAARLSSAATPDAKKFFCSQLSVIGSGKQVPALAPLLADTNLSYYARLALERIPGDESLNALRGALAQTTGLDQVGIISSLAARADNRVIPDLAAIARGNDPALAAVALTGIGRLGSSGALQALLDLEPRLPASLLPELRQAQLRCAASLASAGKAKDAVTTLEKLFGSGASPALRAAAFQAWASARGSEAVPNVLATLKGGDEVLRRAALDAVKSAEAPALISAAASLRSLDPDLQVQLLSILAERQATGAAPSILSLLPGIEPSVRTAAISALGTLGDASTVKPLLSLLASLDSREQLAIANALGRLPGNDVDALLVAALPTGTPRVQLAVIRAVKDRALTRAQPALLQVAGNSSSSEARREAVRALAQIADPSACAPLIQLLGKAPADAVPGIESALADICRRASDPAPLTGALSGAATPVKVALLNALASVGGPPALSAIAGELQSSDPEVRTAALRILADWPDAAALPALGSALAGSPDARSRTLALRGLARLAPLATGPQAAEAVSLIGGAIPGTAAIEQKALLAALGQVTNSASLKTAAAFLAHPALGADAKATLFKILDGLDNSDLASVAPVLGQLKPFCTNAADAEQLKWFALKFSDVQNLSIGAAATNPDGLRTDGAGGPPAAAIDGNPATYWDEEDSQKLYVLRVDLQRASTVAFLRILPWQPQSHAPRDFEVLGDGKLLKKVEGAQYPNTWLQVNLPPTVCRSIELRITGYYPASPAIRELEIYGKPAQD